MTKDAKRGINLLSVDYGALELKVMGQKITDKHSTSRQVLEKPKTILRKKIK